MCTFELTATATAAQRVSCLRDFFCGRHRGSQRPEAGKHYSITVNLFLSLGIISTSVTSKVQDLEANARPLINAADKYGIVNLKLEAEAYYVKSTTLTIDNMLDNLLYADSKNLALLKEAVMEYVVENGEDIVGKVSFENVPGHMISDLLVAMNRGKKKVAMKSDASDYKSMKVTALRNLLLEKGLEVDGSREAMIALLEKKST